MARKVFDYAATRYGANANGIASPEMSEAIMKHGTDGYSILDDPGYSANADIRDLLTNVTGDTDILTPNDLVFAQRVQEAGRIPL